jgi:hypothetical protein
MGVGALVVNIMGVGSSVGDCDGAGPQEARINTRSNDGLRFLVNMPSLADPCILMRRYYRIDAGDLQQAVNLSSEIF